ncbi:hypothetical protein E3J61_03450 [Candidatus Dependentiae bacterium]|nr:MAG: hypothetical protein E3J61_03450 [Candidatus Dependentiae bacterium]
MNKKLFSVLILLFFVAQPAHAYCGWVARSARFVADGASDIFQVLKPELRTESKLVPEYKKGENGQPGKFEHAHQVKKVGEKKESWVVEFSDLEKAVEAMVDDEENKEEYQSRLRVFKEAKRAGKAKKALGPFDFGNMLYVVDLNGAVFCLNEVGDGLREADPGLQSLGPIGNGPPVFVLHTCSKFLEKIKFVTYEEQTNAKQDAMRFGFLKSLRGFKRDTKLLGCYVFMKPYALACAAGLTFGAYKLYEKLEIYEKFLKPNTHGLKEDELDSSL